MCCCPFVLAEATSKQSLTLWVKFGEVFGGFEALRRERSRGVGGGAWGEQREQKGMERETQKPNLSWISSAWK